MTAIRNEKNGCVPERLATWPVDGAVANAWAMEASPKKLNRFDTNPIMPEVPLL